jgi:hypothetical protein
MLATLSQDHPTALKAPALRRLEILITSAAIFLEREGRPVGTCSQRRDRYALNIYTCDDLGSAMLHSIVPKTLSP